MKRTPTLVPVLLLACALMSQAEPVAITIAVDAEHER